jgi:hypothetical protein
VRDLPSSVEKIPKKYSWGFLFFVYVVYICLINTTMENEYKLTTKSGEVIKRVRTHSLESASEMFSKIKKLELKELLTIYNVKQC